VELNPLRYFPLHSTVHQHPRRTSSPSMELSPPPPGPGVASAIDAKRARKRSRYLSPPYTDTDDSAAVQVVDDDAEEEEPPPDVCAVDVLSALRAAALLSLDPNAAQAFSFLALYRRRTRRPFANPLLCSPGDAPAAGVGHKPMPNLSTGPATAMPTPAPGSKKKKKQQRPSQSDVEVGAAPPKRRRKNKSSTGQQHHFQNPVALVLDFAQGTPPPSRDELLSTFCKFGYVIHSETAILSARVVFATRAEAEAAYSCAQTLGAFGPPFATPRLQDLPPIALNNASLPLPNLPLKDVRNNLEKMILSLTSRSSTPEEAKSAMGNLLGEMKGLLAKVDKMLHAAASSSSTVHHHH
jgi:hypothetical protein